MPLYEVCCVNNECQRCALVDERYYSRFDSPDPDCRSCSQPVRRCISTFATPFLGAITARYNDPNCNAPQLDGHWAWRRKSSSKGERYPEPVFIDTWDKRKQFMKEVGLIGFEEPGDMRPDANGAPTIGTGMPGCWTGLVPMPAGADSQKFDNLPPPAERTLPGLWNKQQGGAP